MLVICVGFCFVFRAPGISRRMMQEQEQQEEQEEQERDMLRLSNPYSCSRYLVLI
jgi:hypothetical protein